MADTTPNKTQEKKKKKESIENQALTPGQQLKHARQTKKYTLKEIAHHFKLNVQSLQHLEDDHYEDNQLTVYTRGYLKNYAKFLELDSKKLLTQLVNMGYTSDYQAINASTVHPITLQKNFTIAREDIYKATKISIFFVILLGFTFFAYHTLNQINGAKKEHPRLIDLNQVNHLISLKKAKTHALMQDDQEKKSPEAQQKVELEKVQHQENQDIEV